MKRLLPLYLLFALVFTLAWATATKSSPLTWAAVNVNSDIKQGDAHLISKNGQNVLIDTGAVGYSQSVLIPFLKSKGVIKIDHIYISHPHDDHDGGVKPLIASGIKIGAIHMTLPPKQRMDVEYWGGKYSDLLEIKAMAKKHNIPVFPIKSGEKIVFDKQSYIKVLYSYDGIHTPIGKTDINDMSAIMMIVDGKNRFLLTGDLNHGLGKYLALHVDNIKADILKAPHHGTETFAPDIFFKKVDPKVMIVPAPQSLWCSKRSERSRKLALENNYTTYINGFHGDITVTSDGNKYTVETELQPKDICNRLQ